MAFGKWHDIEVEDDVTAFVTYPNGATGVFVTSTGDAPGTNRFEITLDKGKLVAENGVLTLWELETPDRSFPAQTQSRSARRRAPAARSPWRARPHSMWACSTPSPGPSCAASRSSPPARRASAASPSRTRCISPRGSAMRCRFPFDEDLFYSELMKRVKTSRRKEHVSAAVADLSGTYGGAKA